LQAALIEEITMITIYGYPFTRSTRATWALEEIGVEYDFVPVNLSKGEHKKPEFLKINPGGKVPALVDGDLFLAETSAIVTYICEKFPASRLVPSDIADRARYFQWAFFNMTELEAPLWVSAKHTSQFPEARRVPAVAESCLWEFYRANAVLAQHMEGREYAVGDRFTAADIMLCGTLNWARKSEISLESPVLDAYADRILARPALAKAREREAKAAA
jgi:glutathione S-transferase